MANSNIRFRTAVTAAVLCIALSLAVSCNKKSTAQISLPELMELIHADVFDSTSVFFGDYSKYPSNISKLPVGVFCIGSPVNNLLSDLLTRDKFDNITGSGQLDDLSDMAGENFVTFTIHKESMDSIGGAEPLDMAVLHTLFLTGNEFFDNAQQTKIIVAGGEMDDVVTTDRIQKFLSMTNTGVKYISVAGATAETIIDSLENLPGSYAVAFLGETETIKSERYAKHLANVAKERGFAKNVPVINQSISDTDASGIPMVDAALIALLRNYRISESSVPIKAIIVEPDLDDEQVSTLLSILNYYRSIISTGANPYKSIIAEDVIILNPNKCAATKCYQTLRADGNLALSITEQLVSRYSYPSGFNYAF
ncbi:MAG: hypothetical protein J6Z27_03665 [Bacteroidales bacterium]|nr:hypothetical protein [Bacteroidales bacterium]